MWEPVVFRRALFFLLRACRKSVSGEGTPSAKVDAGMAEVPAGAKTGRAADALFTARRPEVRKMPHMHQNYSGNAV